MAVVNSALSSVAAGDAYRVTQTDFNVSLAGTFVGTAQIERSFDGGTTWQPLTLDLGGAVASFSVPVSFSIREPESGVLYRWSCTAYTSGTLNGRFGP